MKIAMFVHAFPPSIGGTQQLVYNLSRRLANRGHEVLVYSSHPSGIESISIDRGVKITQFPIRLKRVSRPWHICPDMSKIIFSSEINDTDVIHGFSYITFQALVAAAAGRLRRIPTVLHPEYHPFPSFVDSAYENVLGRFVFASADMLVAQCTVEKNFLLRYAGHDKIKVIPCGIESEALKNLPDQSVFREKLNFDVGTKIILYVGALSGHKRILEFIDLMPRILKVVTNTKLVIIGSGSKGGEIAARIRELGLGGNIMLMQGVSESVLKEVYAAADVFVLPSKHESFGIVLLEAAASGKPIVSTRVGVAPDLIEEGINGFVCKSLEEMPARIVKVLTNHCFSSEAAKKRSEVLRNYDWDTVTQKLEEVYGELVN